MQEQQYPRSKEGSEQAAQIFGSVLRSVEIFLEANGIRLEDLARWAGVTLPPRRYLYSRFIALQDFAHLIELASKRLDEPLLGLKCTEAVEPRPIHPLMLAIGYAPDLRTSLDVVATHHRSLIDLAHCEIRSSGRATELVWKLSGMVVLQDQVIDRIAAVVRSRLQAQVGAEAARKIEVRLSRSRPADPRLHRQIFGPTVEFEAEANSFILPSEILALPNPRHDEALFAALLELSQRRLADRGCPGGIAALVREEIATRISDADLSLETVARALGMSGRALQRRLSENGVTFQELYDTIRRDMASELLENTNLAISEIAFRLGFSAVGNFTRAAKRWFGDTPSVWRQTKRS
ncbi:AraC family transcriptional regulator [Polymorphum gilvum]|uniref:AraC family transcriptional regulator n=1 Tax=Polymorphum gilvum (strain LMG 25793 / CGMCC 1.9160 / SL003B-26A1) TaxID=991905 RepID=F2J0M2_POLGS|nr:AraC family transcriptional regulator [Polymorphum gilvum]ADZ69690.1 AraC family transcriptional regulator [Polymorphum gilvum SL003B-26A1]